MKYFVFFLVCLFVETALCQSNCESIFQQESFKSIFKEHGYNVLVHSAPLDAAVGIVESKFLYTPENHPRTWRPNYYPGKVFFDVLQKTHQLRGGKGLTFLYDLSLLDHFTFHLAPHGYWAGRIKEGDLFSLEPDRAASFFGGRNGDQVGELIVYGNVPAKYLRLITAGSADVRDEFIAALRARRILRINGKLLKDFVRLNPPRAD